MSYYRLFGSTQQLKHMGKAFLSFQFCQLEHRVISSSYDDFGLSFGIVPPFFQTNLIPIQKLTYNQRVYYSNTYAS